MICVFDIGEMLWEVKESYPTIAAAMDEAEAFIAQWREVKVVNLRDSEDRQAPELSFSLTSLFLFLAAIESCSGQAGLYPASVGPSLASSSLRLTNHVSASAYARRVDSPRTELAS